MAYTEGKESKLIGRTQRDPEFRKQFVADPIGTLRQAGVEIPPGVSLKVFEQTPTQRFLILPPRIDEGELLERDLEAVTGGAPRGGGGACVAPTNSCALNTG